MALVQVGGGVAADNRRLEHIKFEILPAFLTRL